MYHEVLKDELVGESGVDHQRVRIVPLPIDTKRDQATGGNRPGRTVLFFGTFREDKGLDVLIDAINRSAPREGVDFVFAGQGSPSLEKAT